MRASRLLRILRHLLAEPRCWFEEAVRFTPGHIGLLARRRLMRCRLAALGESATFEVGTLILGGENISIGHRFGIMRYSRLTAHDGFLQIGDRVSINSNVCVDAANGGHIVVGDDVLVGPNVVLRASNHKFEARDIPINQQGHQGGSIVIENDVWIAANAVVVAGVTIGSHAVVAAGAVVTKDVEPWAIVGGVPAQVISRR